MTDAAAGRSPALTEPPRSKAGLREAVASEWTKFRTMRSTWVCLIVMTVVGIGLSVLILAIEASQWAHLGSTERGSFDQTTFSSIGVLLVGEVVVGVLGALAEVKSIAKDSASAQQLAQEALKKNSDYRPAMVTIARDHYRARRLDLALYALQALARTRSGGADGSFNFSKVICT